MKELYSFCISCKEGYFLNSNETCEKISIDKCSFNSIIKNFYNLASACVKFCYYNDNNIIIKLRFKKENISDEIDLSNLYYDNTIELIYLYGEINEIKFCLNNLGEGDEYSPINLKYCKEAYYYPDNGTYVCIWCLNGYSLDFETNICEQNSDYDFNDAYKYEICDEYHFKEINNKKCIDCGNILEGGIDKCLFCEFNGEKAICKLCVPGYILLANNNSCLEIVQNKELQFFSNCEKLILENNKLICSKPR